ncbi:MAG: hypothetical protein ACRDQZ_14400, partial [Mycobacteriales bacterium]
QPGHGQRITSRGESMMAGRKRSQGRGVSSARASSRLAMDIPRSLPGLALRKLNAGIRSIARRGWRGVVSAGPNAVTALRRSINDQRTIRPEPIGPKRRNLRRIYSIALVGVAGLTVIARVNNAKGFTTAFFIALLLGLIFIAWTGYRSAVATAAAIGWWLVTTPLISLLAAAGLPTQEALLRAATSREAIIGTGIAVWVCAVLMRARRSWVTITVCWILNVAAIGGTAYLAPRYTLVAGWIAIALYLTWRAGWLLALYDRGTGRARMGRAFEMATEEQYEVYGHLADLSSSFVRLYQLAVPDEYKPATTLDAIVVGPTGLFHVTAVDGLGRIAVNTSERRRVTVEGAAIDGELTDIARTAQALARALRVEVVPLVAMCGSTFPEGSHGLISIAVTLPGRPVGDDGPSRTDTVPLTLIDAELLARRISFGSPVYTAGQVHRIIHRANTVLWPAAGAPDRRARRLRRGRGAPGPFTPGVEVEWVDDSGTWSGWVCVSRVTTLDEVPKGPLASTLSVKDRVVWIVAKKEWERARSEDRDPDPELMQPVAATALRIVRPNKQQTSPAEDGAS